MQFAEDRTFTRKKIVEYSNLLKLPLPLEIIYTQEEWANRSKDDPAYQQQILRGEILGANRYYKIMPEFVSIFINLGKHRSREQLEHTVVHELVHSRYRKLEHGYDYEYHIQQIKKGKYPVKKNIFYFLFLIKEWFKH